MSQVLEEDTLAWLHEHDGFLDPCLQTEDMVKRYSEPWVKRYCKRETLVKIDGTVDNAILWAFAYWSAFRKFPGQVCSSSSS